MLVVQLGGSVAVSSATLFLQRFGARVVRFEKSEAPHPGSIDTPAAIRLALSAGQERVAASADELTAREIEELLDRADLVVDDHSLQYWLAKGVDLKRKYERTAPRASWCGMTAYGLSGIGENWEGNEFTYQASGPLMIRLGEKGRHPVPVKGPQAELLVGTIAATACSAVEVSARRNGRRGSLLDISIQECQYIHSELGVSNWHFNGFEMGRTAREQRWGVFETLDGPVFMIFHEREWPRIAGMIGRPDLASDPRFAARYERAKHMDELDTLLTPWFMTRTRIEAVEAGQAAGVPMAFGQTPVEVLSDPQLKTRDAFETITVAGQDVAFPTGLGKFEALEGFPRTGRRTAPTYESVDAFRASARPDTTSSNARGTVQADARYPLRGIRVLDLTNTWAGPRAATFLGDLGAEVIKLEGIDWMDMLRGFTSPPTPNPSYPRGIPGDRPWDRYIMWLGLARNKLSAAVELSRPEAREILDSLIAASDVVMTNMTPASQEKYGLHYDRLSTINPRIIYATLSGYGEGGPRAHWKLFGDGQASMAGLFYSSGYEGDDPISFGAYGDPVNGASFALQIVAALLLREETGRGTQVDVSAVETCAFYNLRSLLEAQLGLAGTENVGLDAQGSWPHGVYRCLGEDRWIAVSCETTADRIALIEGLQSLGAEASRSLVVDADAHPEERARWEELLSNICAAHEPELVEQAFRNHGVLCQKVMRGRDIDGDPVLGSRGYIQWLWREDLGTYPVYSPPWLIDGQRPAVIHAPARLGEDNEYVLGTVLGKSRGEIDELAREHVIGDTPRVGAELASRTLATSSAGVGQ